MIDFHIHSVFSDGELIPAEIIRRAEAIGYRALAITDHADQSNIDWIIPRIVKIFREVQPFTSLILLPGVELTHVPPRMIPDMAKEARKLGARIIVVHGETLVEPVKEGTNKMALQSDIDILAHPGLITEDEVVEANERGIYLEITSRKGHSLSNGHVAKLALKCSAKLVIDTDSHSPDDFILKDFAIKVLKGAGLIEKELYNVFENMEEILRRKIS
ncbi:MAG TPA: histidinol phosphate phosphatase domain-containing protein [Thermodesulfovibrio thiophilus]|uniref:histidinol phosphate phosphatase domain-containing protein n=1 Tax=Thermodesulfovibrio thiophilus TaxID=340095 RepID=UPI0018036DEE|nr:histidinol phosphate phosphatase domain-containing protein [Thermodesulfovibrio thiophilus]HHW20055.1 histidinol phosphate phosphatase domain-containing protein [Thermodesulfovibrio thiophilus]HOA83888.1 histidinol phosphate phosphatase domain-containing protein [Thermodesulfovibrio thiophilus]HQA04594.1 histidinol phosphate phosphatase domain-containing protein [Thermodesulfovibrio thiophilus]HQD36026.1 histidinol phosphate phosphatase domain-containing protein [Thermodesulfovibrio thiophil